MPIAISIRFLTTGILVVLCACAAAQSGGALTEIYRAATAALESGDAARCVSLLEPHRDSAAVPQRGPLLFTLGVALLKLGRPAQAELALRDAAPHFEGQPKLAEAWALIGDARAAQGKSAEARQAYAEVARLGGPDRGNPVALHAAGRIAELDAADSLARGDALAAVGRLRTAAELLPGHAPEIQSRLGEIAGNRKLRGEATAASIFALGEIEERGGRLPEAIAYYQRVFVSWIRYPAWVARSYLRAAECFDKLGRRKEAIAHLHEMMRKAERLRGEPEFRDAQRRLREWTPAVRQ